MTSFIGWLDYSEVERRQVQEMLQLFRDKGTVDDLGIGTLRDAISNRLFPGTSVIQTRARYFLFVPWIFQRAEGSRRGDVLARAEAMERNLIGALLRSDDLDGLIGRQAGKDVRNLPSAIYWTGLAAYDIFRQAPLTRAQYDRAARTPRSSAEQDDELAERAVGFWRQGIPEPPDDFFDFDVASFAMTRDEAGWLSERVLSTEVSRGPNLLSAYVSQLCRRPGAPAGVFWEEPLPASCDAETTALVAHAERFSSAMQGAALLYNLMLAEERGDEARGDAEYAAEMRAALAEWADDASVAGTADWGADLRPFRDLFTDRFRRSSSGAWAFVADWCQILSRHPLDDLAGNKAARTLVRDRELRHKRAQARFGNKARLRSWEGESGTARLEFRWSQVCRFLTDLSRGLHGAAPANGREVTGAAH